MKIQQIMTRAVWTCRPSDALDAAAQIMNDNDCGSVVVVDGQDKPLAMITDRDICMCALKTSRPLNGLKVSDAMSRRLFACRLEDPVVNAETTMTLRQVRRLPVIDRGGNLAGILSLDDIARVAARDADDRTAPVTTQEVGRTLGSVARPRVPPPRS